MLPKACIEDKSRLFLGLAVIALGLIVSGLSLSFTASPSKTRKPLDSANQNSFRVAPPLESGATWGASVETQKANLIEVCAVPAHIRVGNLAIIGGWGRAHIFSDAPGAFVGDIFAKDALPRDSSQNLLLNGSGYVLVNCHHPYIVHLRCEPNFWSCFQLTASRSQESEIIGVLGGVAYMPYLGSTGVERRSRGRTAP